MARAAELDFESYVKEKKGDHPGQKEGGSDHAYAYVSDRTTRAAFEKMKPVELAMAASVRAYKSFGKNQILGTQSKSGRSNFPRRRADAALREHARYRLADCVHREPADAERDDLRHQRPTRSSSSTRRSSIT